jgi:hypothetical protein
MGNSRRSQSDAFHRVVPPLVDGSDVAEDDRRVRRPPAMRGGSLEVFNVNWATAMQQVSPTEVKRGAPAPGDHDFRTVGEPVWVRALTRWATV